MTVLIYLITYMDRVIISTTGPVFRKDLGISLIAFGTIQSAFLLAYALFQIPGGWLGDRIGPRRALTLIASWWSAFTALTAIGWNAASMIAIQWVFGMGEAGAFPIATRSLSRWMRPSERGFAQGITHAGSRVGGAAGRNIVALIMLAFTWRTPFLVLGVLGALWAIGWYVYYRDSPEEHHGVNAAELEQIQSAGGPLKRAGAPVPWRRILSNHTIWMISLMYVCYQWALQVYLTWFPTYLKEFRGMSLAQMGFYASLPLWTGVLGDLAGGWTSDLLLRLTGNIRSARRIVGVAGFLIAAAGILPATLTHDPKACVWFSCLAFGGLELTVSVSWAIPLDIAGDFAGSASAVMNSVGNLGGVVSTQVLPILVTAAGWNTPFLVTSALCAVGALMYTRIDASKRIALS
ncbi:MAG TPA: MFS transporter [Bryobacteraceae bacterium]|jgi:sugar phosphate permease